MRRGALLVAALLALGLPAAVHAKTPQSVTLRIDGGSARKLTACGTARSTTAVPRAGKAAAAIRLAEPSLGFGGRRARLLVDRCENGRWRRLSSNRFGTRGPYRPVRTYSLALPAANSADLRVQATVAADRHRRAAASRVAYLRVGVGEIVDLPVGFQVDNVNRTQIPCEADGKRYRMAGHLMAPRSSLEKPERSVMLVLHGLEISDAYFRYRGVPGYDFQGEMAELGHALVTVDRLGYGESGLPPAGATCLGAQADAAHQAIDLLRDGGYELDGGKGLAFKKVGLLGHSLGSFTAEIAAATFKNEDVLSLNAFAAEGTDLALLGDRQARGEAGTCNGGGGVEKRPGGPTGYAYLWPDTQTWSDDTFFNTDPKVLEDSKAFRERSPCGDISSQTSAAFVNGSQLSGITVPVIMIFGKQDKVFPSPAGERHRTLFTGASDLTMHELDGAGHTLMLQRTAPEFRQRLSAWLTKRGY